MPTFFEMFQMVEAGRFGDFFNQIPSIGGPTPAPAPTPAAPVQAAPAPTPAPPVPPAAPQAAASGLRRRVVMRGEDPNSALTGKKNLRHELDPHARSMVRTGRYDHGTDRQDVNDNDAYYNAVDKNIRRAERGPEVGQANLHSVLTGANDPQMKIKPDFLASKIMKQIEANPDILKRGVPLTAVDIYQALRPALGNYQPEEIIPSLDRLASMGKLSGITKSNNVGADGRMQHTYTFNRSEGQMDNPHEDEFIKPRYTNPARQGGMGKVGDPRAAAPQAQPEAAPTSAAEAAWTSFKRGADKLDQMVNGQLPVADTQKLTLFGQLRDMQDQAKQMLTRLGDADPQKAKQIEQVIALMDQKLKQFNPARWVSRESVEKWAYYPV